MRDAIAVGDAEVVDEGVTDPSDQFEHLRHRPALVLEHDEVVGTRRCRGEQVADVRWRAGEHLGRNAEHVDFLGSRIGCRARRPSRTPRGSPSSCARRTTSPERHRVPRARVSGNHVVPGDPGRGDRGGGSVGGVCDTLVSITPDGVLFAKNSDRDPNEAQIPRWYPASDHGLGAGRRRVHLDLDPAGRTHPRRAAVAAVVDVGRRDGSQRARRRHRQRGGVHQPAARRSGAARDGPPTPRPGTRGQRSRSGRRDRRTARTPRPGRTVQPREPRVLVPQQLSGGGPVRSDRARDRRRPTGRSRTSSGRGRSISNGLHDRRVRRGVHLDDSRTQHLVHDASRAHPTGRRDSLRGRRPVRRAPRPRGRSGAGVVDDRRSDGGAVRARGR